MRRLIDENHAMRTLRFLPLVLAAGLAVSTSAAAQGLPRFGAPEPHVKAELIAASDAVVAGQPLQVGVRLTHDDEWHTYWQVPGDSGLPTQINWSLPAAMVAGPIEWPHPHRLPAGPLVNFGYEGDTLLLTTLQVPANLTGQCGHVEREGGMAGVQGRLHPRQRGPQADAAGQGKGCAFSARSALCRGAQAGAGGAARP